MILANGPIRISATWWLILHTNVILQAAIVEVPFSMRKVNSSDWRLMATMKPWPATGSIMIHFNVPYLWIFAIFYSSQKNLRKPIGCFLRWTFNKSMHFPIPVYQILGKAGILEKVLTDICMAAKSAKNNFFNLCSLCGLIFYKTMLSREVQLSISSFLWINYFLTHSAPLHFMLVFFFTILNSNRKHETYSKCWCLPGWDTLNMKSLVHYRRIRIHYDYLTSLMKSHFFQLKLNFIPKRVWFFE